MIETTLLTSHIVIAVTSLIFSVTASLATKQHDLDSAKTRIIAMWLGTVLTTFSGIALTFVANSSLTKLCATLFAFMIAIIASHAYFAITSQKLARENAQI
jgi:bacteriorhodopsin